MSVAMDYQEAIEGAIQLGLHDAVPDLAEVEDADVLTFRNRGGSAVETLSYPFATYRFEDEGQLDDLPTNPPRPTLGTEIPSIDTYWTKDVLQQAWYPWTAEYTITVIDRMTHPQGHARAGQVDRQAPIRTSRYARQMANWFSMHADGSVDPEDGTLRGMRYVLIDPDTGEWVDQANPPNSAVFVKLLITHVGRIQNRTTILEDARGEHRREFVVRIGGANAYELRVPTIESSDTEQTIRPNGRSLTDDITKDVLYGT